MSAAAVEEAPKFAIWTGRRPRDPRVALRAVAPDGSAVYALRADSLTPSQREEARVLGLNDAVRAVLSAWAQSELESSPATPRRGSKGNRPAGGSE